MRFRDKTAIVTGSSGGIGSAVVRRLAAEGAGIVMADRSQENAAAIMEQAKAEGAPDVWLSPCDVSSEADVAATVQGAMDRFRRVDLVVNNAAIESFKTIEDLTGEDWMNVLGVNLLGAVYFTKHAFRTMKPGGFTKHAFRTMKPGGAIVNISSIHAVQTDALLAPYAAAKAAMLSLTRTAAIEDKPKGIRSNAILPGAIDTRMLWDNPNVQSGVEKIEESEIGQPDDIAAAVAFLGSEDARFHHRNHAQRGWRAPGQTLTRRGKREIKRR